MDDFEIEDFDAEQTPGEEINTPSQQLEDGVHVIKEALPPKSIKAKNGINWVFPLMTCQNGVIDGALCSCGLQSTAFMGEDCCHLDEKPIPVLCPNYQQKENK